MSTKLEYTLSCFSNGTFTIDGISVGVCNPPSLCLGVVSLLNVLVSCKSANVSRNFSLKQFRSSEALEISMVKTRHALTKSKKLEIELDNTTLKTILPILPTN